MRISLLRPNRSVMYFYSPLLTCSESTLALELVELAPIVCWRVRACLDACMLRCDFPFAATGVRKETVTDSEGDGVRERDLSWVISRYCR